MNKKQTRGVHLPKPRRKMAHVLEDKDRTSAKYIAERMHCVSTQHYEIQF